MKKYYVYALLNLAGIPFYIGKGCAYRCRQHTCPSILASEPNKRKKDVLLEILDKGKKPAYLILHTNLTEYDAFEWEQKEIERYRKLYPTILTNILDGGVDQCKGQNNPASKSKMSLQRRIEKSQKGAKTTIALGLLKGENHPLYGKGHSEKSKQKISDNHADCSGEHNSRAKNWKIINPNGDIFIIKGTLKVFCKQNKLSYGKMIRSANKGKITEVTSSTLSTLHWEIQKYG